MPRLRPKRLVKRSTRKRRLIRLDNDERRRQLLAMGRTAFTEHSYDEVSIDELAKKAKISKGLFYYYFPTKRDLYIAGLKETAQELVNKLTGVKLHDTSPRERAMVGVDAYLEHVASQSQGFVALMRGGIGSDPEVAEVVESVRLRLSSFFLEGTPLPAGNLKFEILVRGWIGFVEAVSIDWCANPRLGRDELRELLTRILLSVLAVS